MSPLSQSGTSEVEFLHLDQYFSSFLVLENCRGGLEVLEKSLNVSQKFTLHFEI